MRSLFLSLWHPSPILFSGLLVLCTHFLWAQGTLPLERVPIHFGDTPAPFARVSEVQTRFTYRRSLLTFEKNQGQIDSRMRFFPRDPDYRLPTITVLYPTRTAEFSGKETYLIDTTRAKWRAFAPTYGKVPHETTFRIGKPEHYGLRIPWADSIILRMGQQAKAHPHVTRALTVLKPRL